MPDILLRRFVDVACAMFFAFFGAMHDPQIVPLLRGATLFRKALTRKAIELSRKAA